MDRTEYQTDAAVAADLALALGPAQLIVGESVSGIPHLVMHEGQVLKDLEHLMPNPRRTEQSVSFEDAESFGRYVKTYAKPETIIIAHRKQSKLCAVIDYHSTDKAAWGKHRADFIVAHHEDFQAWKKHVGQAISQEQFAEAIEDLIHTIGSPDGSVLTDMVTKFRVTRDMSFSRSINLANGDIQLEYRESETQPPERSAFPSKITLVMPIYEGQTNRAIELRIRYRTQNGKLSFILEFVQLENQLRSAWNEILEAVENVSGITPYHGAG